MQSIVTCDEMKALEKYTIEQVGISSLVLMERAALACVEQIKLHATKNDKICVVCGTGNNGADGVAIARILWEEKYDVSLVVLERSEAKTIYSSEMRTQLSMIEKLGYTYQKDIPNESYTIFVDAILGIGLKRDITERTYLRAMETINLSNAYIYSVDIPTGIDGDTGNILGCAVRANETITFQYKKVGHLVYPGKLYADKVFCKNIGIVEAEFSKCPIGHFTYDSKDGIKILEREPDSHKGDFGKVAFITGCDEMSGASLMSAGAAFACGAGLVKVLSTEKVLDVIRTVLPEAMIQSLDDEKNMEQIIIEAINWADCVVIGCGIGTSQSAYLKVLYTLKNMNPNTKLVIDADGINFIAKYPELKRLTEGVDNVVYTPHMMELARFLDEDVTQLKKNFDDVMKTCIEEHSAIFVCKDSVTRVYQKKKPVFLCSFGNSGMATAGTGDVLAGILGGILARKDVDIYEGTLLAVQLHSIAGDMAAITYGKNSMTATNITEMLFDVIKSMEEVENV